LKPYNFKSDILPPHCGTCNWLLWEDSTCLCLHPAFLEESDIQDALENEASPTEAVETLYEMLTECEDWHGYNSICNLYNNTSPAEFKEYQDLSRLSLTTRVQAAHQKNSAEDSE
jgi:hypothetical protein